MTDHRVQSRSNRENDESGAVLVLAMVFLIAVSLIVTALLTWVGTSITNSGVFSSVNIKNNSVTNAMNLAIQNTRYSFDPYNLLDSASPQSCLPGGYTDPNGGPTIDVWCTLVWQPDGTDAYTASQSGFTRVITYSACLNNVAAASCAAQPVLQAVVGFDDNPNGTVAPSINPTKCVPISQQGSCGESMTQLSWQWNPVAPAVSSINPPSGSTTGGTQIQITGTGFVAGMTVNFLAESSGAPLNPANENGYNPPVSATVVSSPAGCSLPTCIEADSPVVASGTTYFVTVTTPSGTSAFSSVFTYSPVAPVVAGLSGSVTGGSVTGGNTVTIEGTGFWAPNSGFPAQVFFCPTATPGQASCIASPSNTTNGVEVSTPQSGSQYSTITALSPSVGPNGVGTYYVQVEADNLYSALTSTAASGSGLSAPVFTYSVLVPIVTSVTSQQSPVPPGNAITINGYNFVTGVTVGFCQQTNTTPFYSASCVAAGGNAGGSPVTVTPVSTTQIIVTVPNLGGASGTVYYPIVALPPYTGADQPGNPYNEAADEFTYS